MNLIRWEPFTAMDDLVNRFPGVLGRWPRVFGNGEGQSDWAPPVDISETEHEYLIRATLPAVNKDDVEITVEGGMLTLCGERHQNDEQKDEKFHKVENYFGSFSRTFSLPDATDVAAIKAESKDGVLTIHVPKTKVESKKLTKIRVQ